MTKTIKLIKVENLRKGQKIWVPGSVLTSNPDVSDMYLEIVSNIFVDRNSPLLSISFNSGRTTRQLSPAYAFEKYDPDEAIHQDMSPPQYRSKPESVGGISIC